MITFEIVGIFQNIDWLVYFAILEAPVTPFMNLIHKNALQAVIGMSLYFCFVALDS